MNLKGFIWLALFLTLTSITHAEEYDEDGNLILTVKRLQEISKEKSIKLVKEPIKTFSIVMQSPMKPDQWSKQCPEGDNTKVKGYKQQNGGYFFQHFSIPPEEKAKADPMSVFVFEIILNPEVLEEIEL